MGCHSEIMTPSNASTAAQITVTDGLCIPKSQARSREWIESNQDNDHRRQQ